MSRGTLVYSHTYLLVPSYLSRSKPEIVKVQLRRTVSRPVYVGVKPHLGPKTRFLLLSDSCGFVDVGRLSDDSTGLSFTIAASPRQRSHSRVRVRGTHDHILLSQIRDSPIQEGHDPVFISSRNRVTQLYPRHWVPPPRKLPVLII
jgi:hypothetical protein